MAGRRPPRRGGERRSATKLRDRRGGDRRSGENPREIGSPLLPDPAAEFIGPAYEFLISSARTMVSSTQKSVFELGVFTWTVIFLSQFAVA
ncbi:hypothetical protein GCM10017600_06420 [Streptosporangium carneum]|uniref:Uncharacterized protein n=1 Tax=Streptosporangium carneum TaxID=47481 RepID=A0A9W6HWB4_9ACTN|nr:hypothetical protein GCM10017600_06420 [Streptosporangium carneum]